MIPFVLITLLAIAETTLILAAAVSWVRWAKPPHSDAAAAAHLRFLVSSLPVAISARTSGRRAAPGPGTPMRRALSLWLDCAEGCLLGMLLGLVCMQLGFELILHSDDLLAFFGVGGIVFVLFGARRILRALLAVGCIALMVVVYSPLSLTLIRPLNRVDVLRPAPAIVVLANTLYPDGTMSAHAQARALQAYALLRCGAAPRVLVGRFRSEGSLAGAMRAQMANMGLDYPVEETGVGDNTHDEALLAAKLARERHWDTVILVTHSWHMRRAAATFEKAGLHVLCSPCAEGEYDRQSVSMTHERLAAFGDWLHEVVGYETYRARGWL